MTSVTRQYSAVASHASEAVEKAADSWTQGVRRLTAWLPAVPEVDLVPAVERYFDFVQRAVDINRDITLKWAQAAGTLTGVAREQTQSAGHAVRERAESMGDVVRERAGSFEQAAQRRRSRPSSSSMRWPGRPATWSAPGPGRPTSRPASATRA